MKKLLTFASVLLLVINFYGCQKCIREPEQLPDLIAKNPQVTWNLTSKVIKVDLSNIGNKDAGKFLVYFDADESPESTNQRPQVTKEILGLRVGETISLTADFAPLAHPDNNFLGRVQQITVMVDPKDMVKESNENNNTIEITIQN